MGREADDSTFKVGFLVLFAQGPNCLWCPKNRWSLPLYAFIKLKIDKNE
jgi:hypothetical protein